MALASCGGSSGSTMACQTFLDLDAGAQNAEVASSSGDLGLSTAEVEETRLGQLAVSACEADTGATVGSVVDQLIQGLAD